MLRKLSIAAMAALSLGTSGLCLSPVLAQVPQFPQQPFNTTIILTSGGQKKAAGPTTGTLGVTSLAIANFATTTQQLFIFAPSLSAANCGSTVTGGGFPSYTMELEPNKTLNLVFPTALVFPKIGGVSCIAAELTTAGGSIQILVNGFVQ